jgi:hypothetical protein
MKTKWTIIVPLELNVVIGTKKTLLFSIGFMFIRIGTWIIRKSSISSVQLKKNKL